MLGCLRQWQFPASIGIRVSTLRVESTVFCGTIIDWLMVQQAEGLMRVVGTAFVCGALLGCALRKKLPATIAFLNSVTVHIATSTGSAPFVCHLSTPCSHGVDWPGSTTRKNIQSAHPGRLKRKNRNYGVDCSHPPPPPNTPHVDAADVSPLMVRACCHLSLSMFTYAIVDTCAVLYWRRNTQPFLFLHFPSAHLCWAFLCCTGRKGRCSPSCSPLRLGANI